MKKLNLFGMRWQRAAANPLVQRSILAVLLLAAAPTHAAEKFTRPAMMAAMATNCIAPGLNELAAGAANLSAASRDLQEHPSTNSLVAAQTAWVKFQLAYKRNQMLTHGPVMDAAFWTATFYRQAFPIAVENVIRSPRPINADFVEILGSSARGFYVLEYLLFDFSPGADTLIGQTNGTPRRSATLLLEGPTAERRRLYVRELSLDLERRMRDAATQGQVAGFAKIFGDGGQDHVNLLVNQVLDGIETGLLQPLNYYTGQLQSGTLRYDAFEGGSSGTTTASLVARLDGVRRYYLGAHGLGIDDYVRHVNPELAARLETQFKSAAAALAAIKSPLADALLKNRAACDDALAELRNLERLCKVDVVAALGVTIMFNSNDGD